MKVENSTVFVSFADVYEFAKHWPGFGSSEGFWVEFDSQFYDIIDLGGDTEELDEVGLNALIDEARIFYGTVKKQLTA